MPSATVGAPDVGASRSWLQRVSPVAISIAVSALKPVVTKRVSPATANPPPDASPLRSDAGVRSRCQRAAPLLEVAVTVAALSRVKMVLPATTGSAVMRCLRVSPWPMLALHARDRSAPKAGWLIWCCALPNRWVHASFTTGARSDKARGASACSAASPASTAVSGAFKSARKSSRSPSKINSRSPQPLIANALNPRANIAFLLTIDRVILWCAPFGHVSHTLGERFATVQIAIADRIASI